MFILFYDLLKKFPCWMSQGKLTHIIFIDESEEKTEFFFLFLPMITVFITGKNFRFNDERIFLLAPSSRFLLCFLPLRLRLILQSRHFQQLCKVGIRRISSQ